MKLLKVLIERNVYILDKPFFYYYEGKEEIKRGVRVSIKFNNAELIGFVIGVEEEKRDKEEFTKQDGYVIYPIDRIIDKEPIIDEELYKTATLLKGYYLVPLISILQTMLPPSLKPSSSFNNAPKIKYVKYLKVINDDENELTNKQIEVLRLIKNNENVLKKDIKSISIVKKLLELKRIEEYEKEENRYTIENVLCEEEKTFTKDQEDAFNSILNTDKTISLIQGITGSGKTEIYLHLTKHYLNKNKTVLMLVPEISLTSLMIQRFASRFKGKIAILHSDLTNAEKYDEYRKIQRGEASIVIGARSSIFAPLKNIGLIIIDEEHSESYKQENIPSYNALKVAEIRAIYNKCKIVLGSATPSLESKAKAKKGIYNFVYLDKRINNKNLPKTFVINMLERNNLNTGSYLFSKLLIEKIKDRLSKKEQVILLLNRRGHSTSVYCRDCGKIIECNNCRIPMTYHKHDDLLKCHHCGEVKSLDEACPNCGSHKLYKLGFGIEKIEIELKKIFKDARILRLDSDVAKVRNNTTKIIESFKNHEADILLGTQMVAKGHDFKNVTLVGIVLADIGLSIPSYRSSEKVFNLITQAVGRSGRGDIDGEAIIQTYLPNHFSIICGAAQDYESFYNKEMIIRKATQYPPFTNLISLSIKSNDENIAGEYISTLISDIESKHFEGVKIIGPSIPFISYSNGRFIRQLLIKYKKNDEIKDYINNLLDKLRNKNNIIISVDVDPYDF